MEKIEVSNSVKIEVFDSQDYLQNHSTISKYINAICANEIDSQAREFLDNLNGDIFLQDKKVYIYVLFEGKEPASFAIFSKKSNISVTLDLIWTAKDYSKLGLATILLRVGATDLRAKDVHSIYVKEDEENERLTHLLDSFAKVKNIICDKTEMQYKFVIKDIDDKQILSDINQYLI